MTDLHTTMNPKFLNAANVLNHRTALTLIAVAALGNLSGFAMSTNVQWRVEAAVKEAFDSNVYIQDLEPASPVPGAVPAKKESFVTTVSPRIFADYTASAAFKAVLSYTPDFTWYHNASSEDNMTHRFGVNFGGAYKNAAYDLQNSFTYIDGSNEGPIFGRPGDIPAIGGIPLRDRREAFVYRSGFRYTQGLGKWMLRPVASAYVHDFKTDLRPTPAGADYVYENYIDRQDVSGGLDAGYLAAKNLRVVTGYRYGRQEQYDSVTSSGSLTNSPFDNAYHRVLLGLEGTPWPWLKLGILAGPDIRQFDHDLPGFDSDEMLYYVEASVSILPTDRDTVTLSNRRYEQPAFSSFSMYEDITYDLAWKHKFSDHWAASAGFRIYIGDWQGPVNREDWIYTPSIGVVYTHNKSLSAELSYAYDWVDNKVSTSAPGAAFAEGREFTRHLVYLGVKYSL